MLFGNSEAKWNKRKYKTTPMPIDAAPAHRSWEAHEKAYTGPIGGLGENN